MQGSSSTAAAVAVSSTSVSTTSANSTTIIKFNDLHEVPYGVLSPLSPHPVIVRHATYPSVNHYFQSQRFANSPSYERIAAAPSLWELDRLVRRAEEMGHQAANWEDLKTDVMLVGNYFKFKQNPDAKEVLMSTGPSRVIVYHTLDNFWGDGTDGVNGKNLLGVTLMAVRKRIASEEGTTSLNSIASSGGKKRSASTGMGAVVGAGQRSVGVRKT